MKNSDYVSAHLNKMSEKLDVAMLLYDNGYYTDSISCSYYAVFHAIKAVLEADGIDRDSHKGVLSYFNQHYVRTGRINSVSARVLHYLFEKRNETEYKPQILAGESGAKDALDMSRSAVSEIRSYFLTEYRIEL